MSHVDTVRHLISARLPGDRDLLPKLVDPEFELDLRVRELNPEVFHGYEGLERFTAELAETWDALHVTPVSMEEQGDRVLVAIETEMVGRHSGIAMPAAPGWQLWELRDRRALRMRLYLDESEARAAFTAP